MDSLDYPPELLVGRDGFSRSPWPSGSSGSDPGPPPRGALAGRARRGTLFGLLLPPDRAGDRGPRRRQSRGVRVPATVRGALRHGGRASAAHGEGAAPRRRLSRSVSSIVSPEPRRRARSLLSDQRYLKITALVIVLFMVSNVVSTSRGKSGAFLLSYS